MPLLFVSVGISYDLADAYIETYWLQSLFGMNVDILQNNPSWLYYVYFTIPLFLAMMSTVGLWKCGKHLPPWISATRQSFRLKNAPAGGTVDYASSMLAGELELKALVEACEGGFPFTARRIIESHTGIDLDRVISQISYSDHLISEDVMGVLFHHGASPNNVFERDGRKTTVLLEAAAFCHEKLITKLLEWKADPYIGRTSDGLNALGVTVLANRIETGRVLVRHGISDTRFGHHDPVMELACSTGTAEYVKMLIDEGIPLAEPENRIALYSAVSRGSIEIVRLLLDHEAAQFEPASFYPAIHLAARNGSTEIITALINGGVDINLFAWNIGTPFYCAVEHGHAETVYHLLALGARSQPQTDIRTALPSKLLPLHAATSGVHIEIVKLLLDMHPECVNHYNDCGFSALQIVSAKLLRPEPDEATHLELARMLIQAGADINSHSSRFPDWTALMYAAGEHNVPLVRMLLQAGAKVDVASNVDGTRALHHAFRNHNNHIDPVKVDGTAIELINAGAYPNSKDKDGLTPLHTFIKTFPPTLSHSSKFPNRLIQTLKTLAKGTDFNAVDKRGRTALHLAVTRQLRPAVLSLIRAGAKLGIKDGEGYVDEKREAEGGQLGPGPEYVLVQQKLQVSEWARGVVRSPSGAAL